MVLSLPWQHLRIRWIYLPCLEECPYAVHRSYLTPPLHMRAEQMYPSWKHLNTFRIHSVHDQHVWVVTGRAQKKTFCTGRICRKDTVRQILKCVRIVMFIWQRTRPSLPRGGVVHARKRVYPYIHYIMTPLYIYLHKLYVHFMLLININCVCARECEVECTYKTQLASCPTCMHV